MAIIIYDFKYNFHEAYATFRVDSEKLTEENAKLMLEFFIWDYDKDGNPIEELMKKYGMKAIEVATAESFNTYGVKEWFEESEGFLALDGSQGIELTNVTMYEFNEDLLTIEKRNAEPKKP